MACTHCFNNSGPASPDMSAEVFAQLVPFLRAVNPPMLGISGGEFTEHPDFASWILRLSNEVQSELLLISNGDFLFNSQKTEQICRLLQCPSITLLQITTDPRFYPRSAEILARKPDFLNLGPKVCFCEEIAPVLYPLGRAKENHANLLALQARPSCANLFLIPRQKVLTFPQLILYLQVRMQPYTSVCKPCIDPQGYLHAGESFLCQTIGHISDPLEKIYRQLQTGHPCNRCGLQTNLPGNALALLNPGNSPKSLNMFLERYLLWVY